MSTDYVNYGPRCQLIMSTAAAQKKNGYVNRSS